MSATQQTINDIIKGLVRRGALSDVCKELNTKMPQASHQPNQEGDAAPSDEQKDQLRQTAKIWTALCKLVRSQSNKSRIIDTLYFGSFGRTQVMLDDETAPKTFSYCPGPRSVFNLIENSENLAQVSQQVIDKKLASASLQAIGEVCNCGSDMVQAILQVIRDEVIETVQSRRKEVALNFLIGTLTLSPNNTVQFKSLTVAEAASQQQQASGTSSVRLTEHSLRGLQTNSQRNLDAQSIAERSINFMQQRQSTASAGQRGRRSGAANNLQTQVQSGEQIFATPSQTSKAKAGGTDVKGNTEDAPYFQKRMLRSRAQRTGSHAESAPRYKNGTNPLLEAKEDIVKTHSHLDQFLRDQIMSQKSGHSKNKRSAVSSHSAKRSSVNAMIELAAAAKGKYSRRQQSNAGSQRNENKLAATSIDTNALVAAANVMRLSNYQSDPLAATMKSRSIGLSGVNVTKEALAKDKELQYRTLRVHKNNGDTNARAALKIEQAEVMSVASSKPSTVCSPQILQEMSDIEAALHRKKISNNYHTALPKFMRSQGPFAVYDHAAHKGANSFGKVGTVNEQALKRFNDQIEATRQTRENEKSQFYSALNYMDHMEHIKVLNRQKQNEANKQFLQNQIIEKQKRKEASKAVENLYYKPHFGPEETLVQVQAAMDEQKKKQDFLKLNLTHQINQQKQLSEASRQEERHVDRKFIKAQNDAIKLEHTAMVQKDVMAKQNLRETWQRQMDIKTQHKTSDNYWH